MWMLLSQKTDAFAKCVPCHYIPAHERACHAEWCLLGFIFAISSDSSWDQAVSGLTTAQAVTQPAAKKARSQRRPKKGVITTKMDRWRKLRHSNTLDNPALDKPDASLCLYTPLTRFTADCLNNRPRSVAQAFLVLKPLSECFPCIQRGAGWLFADVQVTDRAGLISLDKRRFWSKREEMLK